MTGRSSARESISRDATRTAVAQVVCRLRERLVQKGRGTFASQHEILGIIAEEYHEFVAAIHDDNVHGITSELEDIAVAAIFGLACIAENKMDW